MIRVKTTSINQFKSYIKFFTTNNIKFTTSAHFNNYSITNKRTSMDQNWLTIEVTEKGDKVLKKCAKEAEGEMVIPQGVKCISFRAFDS